MSWYRYDGSAWKLALYVQPGMQRSEIVGRYGEQLKIRLHAPVVDGKANAALIEYLAQLLGVSKEKISLKQGKTARYKVVEILAGQDLQAQLTRILPEKT